MTAESWYIQMLGRLTARRQDQLLTRFRTRKTSMLLAYLAYNRQPFSREYLIELLWPETDVQAGRNRLKQELSALRQQLEPDAGKRGRFLVVDPVASTILL